MIDGAICGGAGRHAVVRELIILALFQGGPRHGYEIKKDLEIIFGDKDYLNNNQLYPLLHRFEDEGLLRRETASQHKSNRVLYRLTDQGSLRFVQMLRDFGEEEVAKDDEFLIRVSMFDRLPPEQRQWILRLRRKALERRLSHGMNILDHYSSSRLLDWPWGIEVIRFRNMRVEAEIGWVDEMLAKVIARGEESRPE